MIIKARYNNCCFIFTLQSFYYFRRILRKQINYITISRPKNLEEWYSLLKELFNINQEDALKIYDYVFNEAYSHLDFDCVTNKYNKNFNFLNIEN